MNYHRTQLSPSSLQKSLRDRLVLGVGVTPEEASLRDWLNATALAVRERLIERWHQTNDEAANDGLKQVCYLSMEFLLARYTENALISCGLKEECRAALAEYGVSLDELLACEPEPALGNGGLGRLAACFLDSMACLGLPAIGYGIRYEFGMFRQHIVDGWQVERPDDWMSDSNPWEFVRPERSYRVRFGGRVEHRGYRAHLLDTEDVLAVAHDTLVPGHDHFAVNTLRLWGAKAIDPIDLGAFNRGRFLDAQTPDMRSKTVSRILYPDDSTPEGRELRLRQEYFFVSASVQDIVARFRSRHDDWGLLPEKVAIHLNDTHPALAPAELMRLLVDEHRLEWDDAWDLTTRTFAYTNHTLMPEALEVWPCQLLERVVPRHLEIIREIDDRFREKIASRMPGADMSKLTLIEIDGGERVNMGRLSVLASARVNGVSALHSRLVREHLFPDFAALDPARFANVTNGVTLRHWLVQSNPDLSALIDDAIGRGWRRNPDELRDLAPMAGDAAFRDRVARTKAANKRRMAAEIAARTGITADPAALFDVQVKRIHEYKRQLLNILGVIARWNAMRDRPAGDWTPRVVVIAGKAAPSYRMAKLIIKLAHDVAARINADPLTGERLKLAFIPNYNVSVAEFVIPAADLSQQISLAGTEASGTGNMKLALNGALTLGTRDGANIEIAAAVGEENIFSFGLDVVGVAALRRQGYDPREVVGGDQVAARAVEQIGNGTFSPDDASRFKPVVDALLGGDPYMVLADLDAYLEAQAAVDHVWADQAEWVARAVRNIAGMGGFSSDRAIRDYVDRIWQADLL